MFNRCAPGDDARMSIATLAVRTPRPSGLRRCSAACGRRVQDQLEQPLRLPAVLRPLLGDPGDGAHPVFMPPEHTAYARELLGPDAFLAVEQTVVLDQDQDRARKVAREVVAQWIGYLDVVPSRWRRVRELTGMTEAADLADGGSDRLVDAMVVSGDGETVARRVHRQLAAAADHVCVSVATEGEAPAMALPELRELARALGLSRGDN